MMTALRKSTLVLTIALAVASLSGLAQANTPEQDPGGIPTVDRIFLPGLHSWRPVDRKSLILWTSPSRPYLVHLRGPVIGLRFAEHLGIQSTGSTLYARFDSIVVDGFRYPISTITPLTRTQARAL